MPKVKLNRAQADFVFCGNRKLCKEVTYSEHVCPECVALGDEWVHLRICMICGHVGCCDNSKNKHATGHFKSSGHPVIKSIEPGEDWAWCYPDDMLLE